MQQLGQRQRTLWDGRRRSIERARLSANASLPREGKLRRQIRRCMLAHDQLVRMRDLRAWCYPGQPRQHWLHSHAQFEDGSVSAEAGLMAMLDRMRNREAESIQRTSRLVGGVSFVSSQGRQGREGR
jgi:hypothetical protein